MRACPSLPPAMPVTSQRASDSCVSINLTWRSRARPDFRQLDAAPAPVIELGAEFLLQPVHALGEPRLGDAHRLGRVTEIEAFGGGKKELQLTVIHTMSL